MPHSLLGSTEEKTVMADMGNKPRLMTNKRTITDCYCRYCCCLHNPELSKHVPDDG